MAKKASGERNSSTKKISKGKKRNVKKLNKKRGLPVEEAVEREESVGNEGDMEESASNDGADIPLLPDAPPEESLVLDVLEKEATSNHAPVAPQRNFPKKKRSKISKPEQIGEAEYLVRTDKSKFRIVDLSANATASHLRPASNFREEMLAARSNPRRISSKQLMERQQKLKWLSAQN